MNDPQTEAEQTAADQDAAAEAGQDGQAEQPEHAYGDPL